MMAPVLSLAGDHLFRVTCLDGYPVFTDYRVENPVSGISYKVAIRDLTGGSSVSQYRPAGSVITVIVWISRPTSWVPASKLRRS